MSGEPAVKFEGAAKWARATLVVVSGVLLAYLIYAWVTAGKAPLYWVVGLCLSFGVAAAVELIRGVSRSASLVTWSGMVLGTGFLMDFARHGDLLLGAIGAVLVFGHLPLAAFADDGRADASR